MLQCHFLAIYFCTFANKVRNSCGYFFTFFLFQMHSSSCESENNCGNDGEVLVSIATLVTEGRIPGKSETVPQGFHQGPHCRNNKTTNQHACDPSEILVQQIIFKLSPRELRQSVKINDYFL